jgi:hypothetical protein
MNAKLDYSSAFYCDMGPYEGMTAVDVRGRIYMTAAEYETYRQTGSLHITVEAVEPPEAGARSGD